MSSFFALASAALFAGNALSVRLALRGASALTIAAVSIGTNLSVLWVAAALSGTLSHALQAQAVIFLVAGAIAPALARTTMYQSIHLIGVSRAAIISNTTPLFAAILAVPLLGEHLSWRLAVGTVLVVSGVALTLRPTNPEESRRSRAGSLLALNTAVMASISFMLRKIGLRLLPYPVLGSALTMTGAMVALLPFIVLRYRQDPLRVYRGSLWYVIAAGLLSTGGFLAYFEALNLGEVVRVTPLANTTPLFAIILLRVFRQTETVTASTVLGTVVAVGGILFVLGG